MDLQFKGHQPFRDYEKAYVKAKTTKKEVVQCQLHRQKKQGYITSSLRVMEILRRYLVLFCCSACTLG